MRIFCPDKIGSFTLLTVSLILIIQIMFLNVLLIPCYVCAEIFSKERHISALDHSDLADICPVDDEICTYKW